MTALRPYQLDAVERVRAFVRGGARRILIVSPTGSGKTVIAVHIIMGAVRLGKPLLFLAHRRELINQCYAKLLAWGLPPEQSGVLMAKDPRRRPGALVQIASVDTLRNRAKPLADIVIVDECHRALAKSYRTIAEAYPNALHLGLTATPYRADGKGLDDAYDELVVVATPRQLIAEGFLVEPTVYSVPDDKLPNLSAVRVRGGDYDEKALAEAVDRQTLVGDIVEHWQKRAGGARTVAFAVNIEHSKHIAERFNAAGTRAEHLDGMTPSDERDAILARLERGETRVVSSVGVLSEGWDQPSVKCAILARPTKSTGLYLQQAGRILRPWNGERAIILDHAGCAIEHGLPQDDRELTLEGEPKAKRSRAAKPREPSAKKCPECCAVLPPAAGVCPECQCALPAVETVPGEVDAELVEITRASMDEKRAEWERICAQAKTRGFKPGWAFHCYRDKFGTAPPKSFRFPGDERAVVFTEEEKARYLAVLARTAKERGYRPGFVQIRYRTKFGEEVPREAVPVNDNPEVLDAPKPPTAATELVEWDV